MSNRSGGRSAQLGFSFQNRVAAWTAVHILAEQSASLPFRLPPTVTLEFMRCETDHPIGDLLAGTSEDGRLLMEIKHRVLASEHQDAPLGSALAQFVRQFLVSRAQASTEDSQRPLDPNRDRLVLVVGAASSRSVQDGLPRVLHRVTRLTPDQETSDAASNQTERRMLRLLQEHVRRSWEHLEGRQPFDSEVHELVSLMHVLALDVNEGGRDELQAKGLLRAAVLEDATQADAAWSALVEACAGFASEGLGADRPRLQRVLLQRGIELRAPQSFRPDARRLRNITRQTVARLRDFSVIRVGDSEVKVDRAALGVLRAAAEEGSLLVVGEAGAGKSGVLHDLAVQLEHEGRDVVALSVDTWAAQSLGTLRNEMGLAHDLADTLANWPGVGPAFLIVDALDAARSSEAVKTFRDLIAAVARAAERWRVIASVRRYDLRHSRDLKRLFAGAPPSAFQDREFTDTRHVSVPRFGDDELRQVGAESLPFGRVLAAAAEPLASMLHLPINLQLVGELVGDGMQVGTFASLRTQIELLDRYWERRVIRDDRQGDAREALLRTAVGEMLRTHGLCAERSRVVRGVCGSGMLHDLLSWHILSEWESPWNGAPERYVLVFAHHTLFDYAASRLILRRSAQELVHLLADQPELVLLIRPSLDLHFRHHWLSDPTRSRFWDLVFSLTTAEGVPEIASTAGPVVAAEWASCGTDLGPLLSALDSANTRTREAAQKAFQHLVRAIVALSSEPAYPLVGDQAGPWCEVLRRASRSLEPPHVYAVCSLLNHLCDHPERLTSEQRSDAGTTARRLFEFAFVPVARDKWLATHALQAVCRTFESEPVASAALIRRTIEPRHLIDHGFEELPWLERETARLICVDPLLVEDIYKAAFSHLETRDTPTPLVDSRIIGMTSTMSQDYRLALYELADAYPDFFRRAPLEATRALIVALSFYVSERHRPASGQVVEEKFDFSGTVAWIRTDYSFIWDAGDSHRSDGVLKMLDAFEQQLSALAHDDDRASQLREVVKVLAAYNRPAALWRRLLSCAAKAPESLGHEIRVLAWSLPVLTCSDTTIAAGQFVSAIFPHLDDNEREQVERAILSICDSVEEARTQTRATVRDRLLGCLPAEAMVTEEAKQLLADLKSAAAVPPNEPLFRMEWSSGGAYTEEDDLAERGVAIDAEPNRRIRELEKPIRDFTSGHQDSVPTVQEIEDIAPALHQLRSALSTSVQDGVDPRQCGYAWDCLAEACEQISRAVGVDCHSPVGALLRDILLEAARHNDPSDRPEDDCSFDEFPGWGRPAPRVEAAAGLMSLVRRRGCADPAVLEAIGQLSADRVPAVRFQVAQRLICLHQADPELMWSILGRFCREEPSQGVLLAVTGDPLPRLASAYPERVSEFGRALYERATKGPVTASCAALFLGLYLWRDDSSSHDVLLLICERPVECRDEAQRLVSELRFHLTCGPASPADAKQDCVRQRALLLVRRLLSSIRRDLAELEEAMQDAAPDLSSRGLQEQGRTLLELADQVCTEVYFASGAYDDKRAQRGEEKPPFGKEVSARFLREAAPLLDDLAQFPHPHLAHRLLETLEYLVPHDPAGVFQRIVQVVHKARAGGYQYEALAADLIVRIVELYLADYRFVFRESRECQRGLLEVLDTFVVAGWPRAQRLAYRLQEIFR